MTLPSCKSLNLAPILKYNTINYLKFLIDNNVENISLKVLNISKKRINPIDMDHDKKDIKLADINIWRLTTLN